MMQIWSWREQRRCRSGVRGQCGGDYDPMTCHVTCKEVCVKSFSSSVDIVAISRRTYIDAEIPQHMETPPTVCNRSMIATILGRLESAGLAQCASYAASLIPNAGQKAGFTIYRVASLPRSALIFRTFRS